MTAHSDTTFLTEPAIESRRLPQLPRLRPATVANTETVRYLSCPECQKLMNRVNFAKYSGVIMDVCRTHGTFFDRDELHRVITFIRGGGLDNARERARARLVEEQYRLRRMELQGNADRQSVHDPGDVLGRTSDPLHRVFKQLFDL